MKVFCQLYLFAVLCTSVYSLAIKVRLANNISIYHTNHTIYSKEFKIYLPLITHLLIGKDIKWRGWSCGSLS